MKHGTTDLYQRKKKIPTFKICARSIGFASVEDLFNSHPHTPNHCAERSRHSWLSRTVSAGDVSSDQAPQSQPGHPSAERIFDSIIDAETGEILEFSKAKWNVGEGRVNLSTSNILAMGTGKLDIKARAAEQKRIHEQQLMRQEGGHLQQLDDNRASNAMSSSSGSKVQSVPVTPLSKLSKLGSSAFLSNRKLAVSPTLRESKKEGVSLPRQAQRVPISEFTNEMANDEANGEIEPNRERGSGSVRISVERTSSSPTTSLRPLNITESPSRSAKSDRSKSMYDRHPQAQNTSWRHPLITEYLMKGPLNPMHHIHWNPRTNSVLNVDEDGNAIDFRDPDMVELLDPSVVSLPTSHQQETSEVHSIGGDSVSHSEENSKSICSTLDSFGSSTVFSGDRHKRHRPRRGHQSNGLEMGTSLTGSPSSKSVVKTLPKDSSMELVDPVINVTNKESWLQLEEQYFQELYSIGYQLEMNKSLTKEASTAGGMMKVRQLAREFARLKVKAAKELVQAIADEKQKELKRIALEQENSTKQTYLKELRKVHGEERKKAKRYLHALEQDNEVSSELE